MPNTLKLNCLVSGDDPGRIFEVEIAATKTVGTLRKAIKVEKQPALDHVPADTLVLWKISFPVGESLEENLSRLRLDEARALSPLNELSEVFLESPVRKHLHIVVRCTDVPHPSITSESSPILKLNCLVLGDPRTRIFPVEINSTETIGDLKNAIKEKKRPAFDDLPADAIVIWKVSAPDDGTLQQNLDKHRIDFVDGKSLLPTQVLSQVFPKSIAPNHVHVVVKSHTGVRRTRSPRTPEHSVKRPRVEDSETPQTPPNAIQTPSLQTQETPPRLSRQDTESAMLTVFKPFTQYITCLAKGGLDRYFDSTRPEDFVTDPDAVLPTRPMLLLHDLGRSSDMERIKQLFVTDTVHLFAASGSGKTRLSLEGLCHHWGFYISCRGGSQKRPSGSRDFATATEIMEEMSEWDGSRDIGSPDFTKNVKVATRAFAMLICARVFVLKHLLENLPPSTDATVARRRWVLVQVLPPSLRFNKKDDMFALLVRSLRPADTDVMLDLSRTILGGLSDLARVDGLFAVVDEAQVAAEYLDQSFRSFTTGTDMRPVLHVFYRFLWNTGIFRGVILAGTGLSMSMVKQAVSSRSAQIMDSRSKPIVFVEVGQFTKGGTVHEKYIRKYLPLSPGCISDERLVERIMYWFSGRYRLTASLIELLLYTQPDSRHRVLSAFARRLTGFTLTDAVELEEREPALTVETTNMFEYYEPVSLVHSLSKGSDKKDLKQCLFDALMRWRMTSKPTFLPLDGDIHELIALGVGHLEKVGLSQTLEPGTNYPVYLSEPLVALQLSAVFETHSSTGNKSWMESAFRTAQNRPLLGFIFEKAVPMALLEMFGGKSCILSDIFHCNQPWGSRKVTLVSLKRSPDGVMKSYPVSWSSGSSDRLGFVAKSPTDVLKFLNDPAGKCFLFPDTHMGPDLLCFLQDEETKELILLTLQAKILKFLGAQAWRLALESVTPQFFYTVKAKDDRVEYAPSKYPGLSNEIMDVLESMLGISEYKPLIEEYRSKLRGSGALDEKFSTKSLRKTPKYLRIVAAPADDRHEKRLKADIKGDVGVLRWKVVTDFLGSMADAMTVQVPSVP